MAMLPLLRMWRLYSSSPSGTMCPQPKCLSTMLSQRGELVLTSLRVCRLLFESTSTAVAISTVLVSWVPTGTPASTSSRRRMRSPQCPGTAGASRMRWLAVL